MMLVHSKLWWLVQAIDALIFGWVVTTLHEYGAPWWVAISLVILTRLVKTGVTHFEASLQEK